MLKTVYIRTIRLSPLQGLEYYASVGNTEEDNGDENLTTT